MHTAKFTPSIEVLFISLAFSLAGVQLQYYLDLSDKFDYSPWVGMAHPSPRIRCIHGHDMYDSTHYAKTPKTDTTILSYKVVLLE